MNSKVLMRLHKEINEIAFIKHIRDSVYCTYLEELNFTILPQEKPYNKHVFKVQIRIPSEYPFKPPTLTFKTPIYHPNVDEDGYVSLQITSPDYWKPAIQLDHVIQSLIALFNKPEPEYAIDGIYEEYRNDRDTFNRKAYNHAKGYAEK